MKLPVGDLGRLHILEQLRLRYLWKLDLPSLCLDNKSEIAREICSKLNSGQNREESVLEVRILTQNNARAPVRITVTLKSLSPDMFSFLLEVRRT